MKQYEAVLFALKKLGGQATLGQLYQNVMKVEDCEWKTKTPFASIRRIVQTQPEIFKVRPGLYALRDFKKKLNLKEYQHDLVDVDESLAQGHSYYQGLLVEIGNSRNYSTFVPSQDQNRHFVNDSLGKLITTKEIPQFSYSAIVNRAKTIDVIWFNERWFQQFSATDEELKSFVCKRTTTKG